MSVTSVSGAAMRFNPPPNWPPPPPGWTMPPGWRPDPAWGPPPAGWQLWVPDLPPAGMTSPGRGTRSSLDARPSAEPAAATSAPRFRAVYQQGRPKWMREGTLEATLVMGAERLEVVGESHRQDELWRVVGGRHRPEVRVRMDVQALLLAEDGNPYDPNAVSVWIAGLMVGYLPRDEARKLRPGLLAAQERKGTPIAVEGEIIGGGMRSDGPGQLGVFLRYDPEEFGLSAPPETLYADARLRAALGDDLAASKDSPYDMVWLHGVSDDLLRGIKALRKALETEASLIGRHFIYAELEAALYRCRDALPSVLNDYDEACRQHDAEGRHPRSLHRLLGQGPCTGHIPADGHQAAKAARLPGGALVG